MELRDKVLLWVAGCLLVVAWRRFMTAPAYHRDPWLWLALALLFVGPVILIVWEAWRSGRKQ